MLLGRVFLLDVDLWGRDFFSNNVLLFSLLFSENFCQGDKGEMEGDKVVTGVILPVPQ